MRGYNKNDDVIVMIRIGFYNFFFLFGSSDRGRTADEMQIFIIFTLLLMPSLINNWRKKKNWKRVT